MKISKIRKEQKAKAKKIVKKHYLFLVFVCIIAAFLGSNFSNSLATTSYENTQTKISQSQAVDLLEKNNVNLSTKEKKELLNKRNNFIAYILNFAGDNTIVITLLKASTSLMTTQGLTITVLIILSVISAIIFWFFIINTYKVVIARIMLESSTYDKVNYKRFAFLYKFKKNIKTSWNMFVLYIYKTLWSFTIIGGFIKYFSYYLVPYILAENPNMKANQAISLSREMMNGHKFECFVNELSFIGWELLSSLTFGLVGIFFSNPYKSAYFAEYFKDLRTKAINKKINNYQLLNDKYLYEKASIKEINSKYVDAIDLKDKIITLEKPKGIKNSIFSFLGLKSNDKKYEKLYEQNETNKMILRNYENIISYKSYPDRLFTIPEKQTRKRVETANYLRHYSIVSIILIFFIVSNIGWLWEVTLHLIKEGSFVNRGILHGPWLPIYGYGGILILILLNKFRNKPLQQFIMAIILCGIVEYFTGYYLELTHGGQRWWDYSNYFLNLHGRICAEGLLVFGLGGMAMVYFIAPALDNIIQNINIKILVSISILLVLLFITDSIYSQNNPNKGKGITDYSTKLINENIIEANILTKKII